MVDILLPIKQEFAEKILSGVKKFEFRKTIPKKEVNRVYLYVGTPHKVIIGAFSVRRIISGTPHDIWERCGQEGGIDQERFFSYCGPSETVFSMEIETYERFSEPINPWESIDDNFVPPQGFQYIHQFENHFSETN